MDDLIELGMVDFDVILGFDWFHACYALIDFRIQVVKFQSPNEPVMEWTSSSAVPMSHLGAIRSCLLGKRMGPLGCV